jgi:hypothetical protein
LTAPLNQLAPEADNHVDIQELTLDDVQDARHSKHGARKRPLNSKIRTVGALVLGTVIAVGICISRPSLGAPGSIDYRFENSPFMMETAFRNVDKIDRDDSPDGAYGKLNRSWDATHQGQWFIEEQRSGGELIAGGVVAANTGAIKRGLGILRCFDYWATISGDTTYEQLAEKVAITAQMLKSE